MLVGAILLITGSTGIAFAVIAIGMATLVVAQVRRGEPPKRT